MKQIIPAYFLSYDPMPFNDLDEPVLRGSVTVCKGSKVWSFEVDIEQGRAMEADGIPVDWILEEYNG